MKTWNETFAKNFGASIRAGTPKPVPGIRKPVDHGDPVHDPKNLGPAPGTPGPVPGSPGLVPGSTGPESESLMSELRCSLH